MIKASGTIYKEGTKFKLPGAWSGDQTDATK
jgi:hypothetical protein